MSTCQSDSTWSTPTAFPYGALSIPPQLAKPDGPDMICQPLADCKPLNLTYNPNTEVGGEFHCKTPLDWESLPVMVEPSNQCHLLCDKLLVAVVGCKEGTWTGNPEKGFWCHHEKEGVGHYLVKKEEENGENDKRLN